MSLKVNHPVASQVVKQAHLKSLGLWFASIDGYPDDHPYVSATMNQKEAIFSLLQQLSSHYDGEVSYAEHNVLGRLYESDLDEEQWEEAVGVTDYQPKSEDERQGFSKIETYQTGRGVMEIGDSIELIAKLVSECDPLHRIHVAVRAARATNIALGTHVEV
jgi:hypothetical protein